MYLDLITGIPVDENATDEVAWIVNGGRGTVVVQGAQSDRMDVAHLGARRSFQAKI